MKGDFTRDTFDASRHFSRVLMQQGRVQFDADFNEQAAILLHYLQALAADLIGSHGGPFDNLGFGIVDAATLKPEEQERLRSLKTLPLPAGDFLIGRGHYYVDGVLCENEDYVRYGAQINHPQPDEEQPKNLRGNYLVYLDVWERHLTYLEVEDADGSAISIREVALNGPDTATRAQVVWQVKAKLSNISANDARDYSKFLAELGDEARPTRGRLKARAIQAASVPDDPCLIPPEARYRGPENHLYRVEIHLSGTGTPGAAAPAATFKWSRENGSVVFPIREIAEKQVTLETLGRDTRLGLQAGDWVEIVDDDYTLQNRAGPLLQVDAVAYDDGVVTLKEAPVPLVGQNAAKHRLLRRWDQRETDETTPSKNGIPITEGNWIELEDGIQIQFQPSPPQQPNQYRTGDYWLIPARTITGDVEWPGPLGAIALGPHGVDHHYAPLWMISITGDTVKAAEADDLRRNFKPLWMLKSS
jgi:hypothetical protein